MVRGAVARLVLSRMVVSGVAMGSSASGFSASGGRVDLSASAGSKKSNDIIEGESWDEK